MPFFYSCLIYTHTAIPLYVPCIPIPIPTPTPIPTSTPQVQELRRKKAFGSVSEKVDDSGDKLRQVRGGVSPLPYPTRHSPFITLPLPLPTLPPPHPLHPTSPLPYPPHLTHPTPSPPSSSHLSPHYPFTHPTLPLILTLTHPTLPLILTLYPPSPLPLIPPPHPLHPTSPHPHLTHPTPSPSRQRVNRIPALVSERDILLADIEQRKGHLVECLTRTDEQLEAILACLHRCRARHSHQPSHPSYHPYRLITLPHPTMQDTT